MDTMKTELDVWQRLKLAMLLPESGGSFREAIRVRQLRRDLNPDEKEREDLKLATDERGNITWDESKVSPKEFEFSDGELDTISVAFKSLEADGAVPTDDRFLSLYEIFEEHIENTDLDSPDE